MYLKEQNVMYLEECNPKRDPSDDSKIGLHHKGHLREAALQSKKHKDL